MSGSQIPQTVPEWVPTPSRTIVLNPNAPLTPIYLPTKLPSDILDYSIDWSAWQDETGFVITGGLVQPESGSGLTIPAQYVNSVDSGASIISGVGPAVQSALIAAGVAGQWDISFQVFFSAGRSACVQAVLTILDQYIPLVNPVMTDDGGAIVDQNGVPLL